MGWLNSCDELFAIVNILCTSLLAISSKTRHRVWYSGQPRGTPNVCVPTGSVDAKLSLFGVILNQVSPPPSVFDYRCYSLVGSTMAVSSWISKPLSPQSKPSQLPSLTWSEDIELSLSDSTTSWLVNQFHLFPNPNRLTGVCIVFLVVSIRAAVCMHASTSIQILYTVHHRLHSKVLLYICFRYALYLFYYACRKYRFVISFYTTNKS